jgi:hypothetical protein
MRSIVRGIRQQRHRACRKPSCQLDDNETQIQRDCDAKQTPRAGGRVMVMAMSVVMAVRMRMTVAVRAHQSPEILDKS